MGVRDGCKFIARDGNEKGIIPWRFTKVNKRIYNALVRGSYGTVK